MMAILNTFATTWKIAVILTIIVQQYDSVSSLKCLRKLYLKSPLFKEGIRTQFSKECPSHNASCTYVIGVSSQPIRNIEIPKDLQSHQHNYTYVYHGCRSKNDCEAAACQSFNRSTKGNPLQCKAICCSTDNCNTGEPVNVCSNDKPCLNFGTCKVFLNSSFCSCLNGFYGDRCQKKYARSLVCGRFSKKVVKVGNKTVTERLRPFRSQICDIVEDHRCFNASYTTREHNTTIIRSDMGCVKSIIIRNCSTAILKKLVARKNRILLSGHVNCCDNDLCNVGSHLVNRTTKVDYCILKPCKNGGKCVSKAQSYLCSDCPKGFTGERCEKASCFDDNMYTFGPSSNDEEMPSSRKYAKQCWQRKHVDIEFDFYGRRHKSLYVCRNGVIQFGFQGFTRWLNKFGSRRWYRNFGIIAPFWSGLVDRYMPFSTEQFLYRGSIFPHDPKSMSKVYYHAYSSSRLQDSELLDKASQDVKKYTNNSKHGNFTAKLVIVVTWVNIYPAVYRSSSPYYSLSNTFQVVLITDGLSSFTIFNYPCGGIQWVVPAKGASWRNYWYRSNGLPIAGWNSGTGVRNKFLNIKGSGTLEMIDLSKLKGNTQQVGKWFFPLNDGPTSKAEAEQKCKEWYKIQPTLNNNPIKVHPCPCVLPQAWRDARFQYDWNYHRDYSPPNVECRLLRRFFRIELPVLQITHPTTSKKQNVSTVVSQRCCYSLVRGAEYGSLVKGPRYGGHMSLVFAPRRDWLLSDEEAHHVCCEASNLCELYYEKRPSNNCDGYQPPTRRWFFGDPHIVTMDNLNYTFNGLGEYVMADVDNGFFQLQARTKKVGGDEATIFTAGVAKEQHGVIEVRLNDDENFEVLVDGNKFDFSTVTANETKETNNISISREENDALSATFPSGITVTFGEVKGMMTIVLSVPQSFKNKTKGLLGTWNDNPDDDFTLPDGSVIPISSNDSTIHYEFGLKWQITAVQSLFTYSNNQTVDTFKNESYVPLFADELKFYNKTLENKAREVCGSNIACLFDAAATKDPSIGKATLDTSKKLINESSQLANFPPEVVNTTSKIKLILNVMATIIVSAQDKNGDQISFTPPNLPGLQVTEKNNILTMKWIMTSTNKVNFTVILQDSKGASSVWEPTIELCACQNGGNCSNTIDQSGDRFQVMPCICSNGYTGKFCESDIDACAIRSPCFPGVQCQDLPAPSGLDGYKCGPCPKGYSGDGASCTDIDECLGDNNCSQVCINTPGSFRCQCNKGYKLESDGITCTDINECLTPVCHQNCSNSPGSYKCFCHKGFKLDASKTNLCVPTEACNASSVGCNQVCYIQDGKKLCSCNKGYQLRGDNKNCTDINECEKSPCSQTCTNLPGSFECKCRAGFKLDADNTTCKDINECIGSYNCSDPFHKCINTEGSYRCECESGLEMREGSCKEIKPLTTTPVTTSTYTPSHTAPTTPSVDEKSQSLLLLIKDMNINEWRIVERKFKQTVVGLVSNHCQANEEECGLKEQSKRSKRAADQVSNATNVYILPGYPKQNGTNLWLAFYVKSTTADEVIIPVVVLVKIVNGNLLTIQVAIGNKTISEVQRLVTPTTTTQTPTAPSSDTWKWIAIGVGCAVFVLVVIIVIIVVCIRNKRRKKETLNSNAYRDNRFPGGDQEMKRVGESK